MCSLRVVSPAAVDLLEIPPSKSNRDVSLKLPFALIYKLTEYLILFTHLVISSQEDEDKVVEVVGILDSLAGTLAADILVSEPKELHMG